MKRSIKIVFMVMFFVVISVGVIYKTVSAAQNRALLFPVKGTWYVCQGYNTPEITHKNLDKYGLDLTPSNLSFSGAYGCSKTPTAASGQKVYAPANGTVTYISNHPDIMQLNSLRGGYQSDPYQI